MNFKKISLIFALFFIWTSVSEAKTLYVDPNGNDSVTWANNSISTPWRTIGRAVWGSTNRSAPNSGEAAQAGDVVIVNAGTYTTTGLGSRFAVAFDPVNNGTSGNPIAFQANGNVNLTFSSGGGPIIGCDGSNYIIWDGFTVNEANAPSVPDTGPVVFFGSNHCEARNLNIIGANRIDSQNDNHNGIRIEQSNFTRVYNTTISGIRTNGGQGQNDAGIMTYDSNDMIIENSRISDVGAGIFWKGTHSGFTQARNIARYNLIHDVAVQGIVFLDVNDAKAYGNIVYNCPQGMSSAFVIYTLGGGPNRGDIFNNTIHNCDIGLLTRGSTQGYSSMRFWNNIVTGGRLALGSEVYSTLGGLTLQHNLYNGQSEGGSIIASLGANNYTLATIKSSLSQETVSPAGVSVSPNYVNQAGFNFHLNSGSPALALGVDILDIDGDGNTSEIISSGAYAFGSETVGPTSGSVTPTPTPTPVPTPTPTPTPTPVPTPVPSNQAPVGFHDVVTPAGVITSWTNDPDTPTISNNFRIYIDGPMGTGTLLVEAPTNTLRPDVNSYLGTTGNHGIEYSVPSQYRNGVQHSLYVYGVDTSNSSIITLLPGGPITFTLTGGSPTPVPGDINLDHTVNSLDFSIMNTQWLTSNSQSDLRVDGQVNSLDFAILSSNWGRTW